MALGIIIGVLFVSGSLYYGYPFFKGLFCYIFHHKHLTLD